MIIKIQHVVFRRAFQCAFRWIPIGFLVYLCTWFFLRSSQQKTFFYLLLVLPALCLLPRLKLLARAHSGVLLSLVLLLGYFSISAYWGSGAFKEALKISAFIMLLWLAIEASMHRMDERFLALFMTLVGGIAVLAHGLALALSDASLAEILARRYALKSLWGEGNGNPIDSAVIMGVSIVSAWYLFPGRKWRAQLLLGLVMLGAFALMLITQSRGPILALGIALLGMILMRRSRGDLLLLSLVCLLGGASLFLTDFHEFVDIRLEQPDYRFEIWAQSLGQFKNHFWIGQGFHTRANIPIQEGGVVIQIVSHAHMSILEMFRVGGVIGGGLFFLMLFMVFKGLRPRQTGLFFLTWLVYGLLCLSTNGRLLVILPWRIEFFEFWIPLFLLYFCTHENGRHGYCLGSHDAKPQ
jgi:hypothetical protein